MILKEKNPVYYFKIQIICLLLKKRHSIGFFRARYQLSAKAGIRKGGCVTLCFCSGPLAMERI